MVKIINSICQASFLHPNLYIDLKKNAGQPSHPASFLKYTLLSS